MEIYRFSIRTKVKNNIKEIHTKHLLFEALEENEMCRFFDDVMSSLCCLSRRGVDDHCSSRYRVIVISVCVSFFSPMRIVQTQPHTAPMRLMVTDGDGCCDWIAFLFCPRQWRRAHFQTRWIRLARSLSIVSCPEQWTLTCRCLCCKLIRSASECPETLSLSSDGI